MRVTGWEPGFRKVSFTKLIQQRAGLGLPQAKRLTDRILAGEPVAIDVGTPEAAEALLAEARRLGAVAAIDRS